MSLVNSYKTYIVVAVLSETHLNTIRGSFFQIIISIGQTASREEEAFPMKM
jgi:hypothetical protein